MGLSIKDWQPLSNHQVIKKTLVYGCVYHMNLYFKHDKFYMINGQAYESLKSLTHFNLKNYLLLLRSIFFIDGAIGNFAARSQ